MEYPATELERMTVGERVQLIEAVWDSLRVRTTVLPLSEDKRATIESRRAEHRADPASAVAWESVRSELLSDQVADEERTRAPKKR